MFKPIRPTVGIVALSAATFAASHAEEPSETAAEPYAAMRALDSLVGDWRAVTDRITPEGEWQEQSIAIAAFETSLKGLLLTETEKERLAKSGTNPALKLDITFDQYRDVYRLSAIDDGWGIMDIYEGVLAEDILTVTNLRSGTSFPLDGGGELNFRLEIPVTGDTRVMDIDMSTDAGATWLPFYRVTYTRLES